MRNFYTIFTATVSLALSLSVFVHDTHIGNFYKTPVRPAIQGKYAKFDPSALRSTDELRPQPHTHTEYNPLSHAFNKSHAYQSPSIAPRRDSHHKELSRLLEEGGRHAFDNVNLPVIA